MRDSLVVAAGPRRGREQEREAAVGVVEGVHAPKGEAQGRREGHEALIGRGLQGQGLRREGAPLDAVRLQVEGVVWENQPCA